MYMRVAFWTMEVMNPLHQHWCRPTWCQQNQPIECTQLTKEGFWEEERLRHA